MPLLLRGGDQIQEYPFYFVRYFVPSEPRQRLLVAFLSHSLSPFAIREER